MTRPQTKSSTPKLSEVASQLVYPDNIVTTAWPRVVEKCKDLGVEFDSWQHGVGALALGKDADGQYVASVGGVVLSIPRQVGKTFLVGMIIIALCLIFPNLTVLWSAHHLRTSTKTFKTFQGMVKKKKVWPFVEAIRQANGEQEILFTNGSIIMFGARSQGFGRGFDKVDVEVFDEAQILDSKAVDDMVPAVNQAEAMEAGGLLFFMGTPPRPTDPGFEFSSRRKKALSGKGKGLIYVEFSADRGAKRNDRKQWAKANPSYPSRTSEIAMERMAEQLTDDDSWNREALGIWDEDALTKSLVSADHWGMLFVPDGEVVPDRRVVGVKFSVDGALVGLSVGVRPVEGPVHVAGIRLASTAEGYGWIVQWCLERKDRIDQIVIDGKGADAVLIAMLAEAGFHARSKVTVPSGRFIRTPTPAEYAEAHTAFLQAVQSEDMSHGDSPLLDEQVEGSMRRDIGKSGGWGWQPIRDTDNTTLLDSATLAWWGAKTCTRGKRGGVRVG